MKTILFLVISVLGVSAYSSQLYECNGFSGVDEYSVAINTQNGKAAFFDNDNVSDMLLTETLSLESNPPQTQMKFQGNDEGAEGTLTLVFNQTRLRASLTTTSSEGKVHSFGEVSCRQVTSTWAEID